MNLSEKRKAGIVIFFLALLLVLSVFSFAVSVSYASKPTERLWGNTSADTAIAISKKGWVDGSSRVALVARDDYFTDALAGGPLAYAMRYYYGNPAPVLLTGSHSRPDALVSEIMRLGVHKIYLLGGPGAVDEGVETSLNDIPGVTEVKRLWGQSAYGTAHAIKQEIDAICDLSGRARPNTAVIATGENFPDSLVISGPAASKNMPILLVKPFAKEPQPETKQALQGIKNVIIVGGPGAVHPDLENWLRAKKYNVLKRLWGLSEYDTAIDVVSSGYDIFGMDRSAVFITRGDYFTDALAGGPLAAWWGPAPMALVRPDSIPAITSIWLSGYKDEVQVIYILGGTGAVSDGVKELFELIDAKPEEIVQRFLDGWHWHIAQTIDTYNEEADMANWKKMWDLLTDKAKNVWGRAGGPDGCDETYMVCDEMSFDIFTGVFESVWEDMGETHIVSGNQTSPNDAEFVVEGHYYIFRFIVRKDNGLWKIDEINY